MPIPLGYSYLLEQFTLNALPLDKVARLNKTVRGRQLQQQGGQTVEDFEPNYAPEQSLTGQLQFALRYEGINLQVLALLFEKAGRDELSAWLQASPESRYARRACFLYEWLTGQSLPIEDPVSARARYVPVIDADQQFVLEKGERVSRFRVLNNLPGSRAFCPLVHKTDYLKTALNKDLKQRALQVLANYDQDLLRRAAAYLFLKETQSSFEVEREKPSPQKAQRFADLLRQADTREAISEERLVELQQAIIDPRFHEFTWRSQQNWVGKDLGYRKKIDFVPPRPEHVPGLMAGLIIIAENLISELEPVIAATSVAFGFVYIHPFMDGNGRIHRYLIHDVLAKAGFTPRGIVLPVSAVILNNLDEYIETLEHYSAAINRLTEYNPDIPETPATGNECVYFSFPDYTRQAEFLYRALERTVEEDLQQEINYLLGFDKAYQGLNSLIDWPDHSLELFIQVVQQNEGKLSNTKHKSHFQWMTEQEIKAAEEIVQEAFSNN